jgi:hypothetical protein
LKPPDGAEIARTVRALLSGLLLGVILVVAARRDRFGVVKR